jgi:diguanylate cyclase (GGDEF)-like protein/putative nucleotidyltransferase with HDIG domain
MPTRPLSITSRTRILLDGLMFMAGVVTFSWYFILGPTLFQGNETLFAKIVGTAYPAAELVMVFSLFLLSFRSRDATLRPALRILFLALIIMIFADSIYDYQNLQGTYVAGELLDVAWPLGYMLIGLAAQAFYLALGQQNASPATVSDQASPFEATEDIPSVWRSLLPYALVPAVGLLALYTQFDGKWDNSLLPGIYVGGAVLIGLVLLRQVFSIRETVMHGMQTLKLNEELHTMHNELRANNGELHTTQHALQEKNQALAEANTRLEMLATKDPLTELPNHRALLECLEKEIGRARRYGHHLSLLFFDVDHFKRVNDTHGHSVGDAVLQELGRRVRDSLRGGDTIGRYGGEEFIVLLPETDAIQACELAERMRVAIAAHPLALGLVEGGINLTISIGVATFPNDGQVGSEVVDKADQAMYWAKRLGRNQLRTALEAQRASQDSALAATIQNLERRDAPSLDGLSVEQLVRANQLTTIQSLMGLLDLRDQGISAHSYQVSDLAGAIARELGMEQEAVFAVSTAGLLHDIGKIAMPDLLLQKAGTLSANEWALIKQHPELGAQILEVSPYLHNLIPAVGHHHENWDGTGYPDGLAGENIPLAARIIRVSEAYCAMMTTRPYQAQRSAASARSELVRCSATHFDPDIIEAALRVLLRNEEEVSARRKVGFVS